MGHLWQEDKKLLDLPLLTRIKNPATSFQHIVYLYKNVPLKHKEQIFAKGTQEQRNFWTEQTKQHSLVC